MSFSAFQHRWALIQMICYVVIFFLGLVTSFLWKPPTQTPVKGPPNTVKGGDRGYVLPGVDDRVVGVAPSEAETASTEQVTSTESQRKV